MQFTKKFLCLGLWLVGVPAVAQTPLSLPPPFVEDAKIMDLMEKNRVPALGLGLIEANQVRQIKVFGESKKGVPAHTETLFGVASLTKPVLATIALLLVELGELSLDEPLHPYWVDPDIAEDERHKLLTPRLILSHRTGFPNWRSSEADAKLRFQFDPGTAYQYSGEGFQYLSKALEKKTGKALDLLAKELLFEPLEMRKSYLRWSKKIDSSQFAVGHLADGRVVPIRYRTQIDAAGGLMCTVGDYARFASYLMQGKILLPKTFEEMSNPNHMMKNGSFMGLSWEVMPDLGDDELALIHTGYNEGMRSLVILLPVSQRGILIFSNGEELLEIWAYLIAGHFGEIGKEIIRRGG